MEVKSSYLEKSLKHFILFICSTPVTQYTPQKIKVICCTVLALRFAREILHDHQNENFAAVLHTDDYFYNSKTCYIDKGHILNIISVFDLCLFFLISPHWEITQNIRDLTVLMSICGLLENQLREVSHEHYLVQVKKTLLVISLENTPVLIYDSPPVIWRQ